MRAWRYDRFGPTQEVVQCTHIAQPVARSGQVLVAVGHVAIEPLDWKLVSGQFRHFVRSKPPCGIGTSFCGSVKALGDKVSGLAPGQRVVGFIDALKSPPGALQEYVAVSAKQVVPVPDAVDSAQACTLPVAGASAVQLCRLARVKKDQHILIHGAAGGVGSFTVQVAKLLGARVTATGRRESQDFIAALRPDSRLDYTRSLPAHWGGPYDAIIDCASKLMLREVQCLLAPGGAYVNTVASFPAAIFDPLLNLFRNHPRRTLMLRHNRKDLAQLLTWTEQGQLKPMITVRLPFESVPSALAQSENGHSRGKIVITF